MSVQPNDSTHDRHDDLLIARLVGDDVTPQERSEAERLVATCAECAALASDLRSIMSGVAALPAPTRPRDFRLTEADAARLRPRGMLARIPLLSSFGAAGSRRGIAGALGAAMATLGLAGMLVSGASAILPQAGSTVLFGASGSGGSGAASAYESQAAAPAYGVPAPSPGVEAATPPLAVSGPASSPAAGASATAAPSARVAPSESAATVGREPIPAATAAPSIRVGSGGSGADGGQTRDNAASPGALGVTSPPALKAAPAPEQAAPAFPILPVASLALLVVGAGLLVLARLAGARPPI